MSKAAILRLTKALEEIEDHHVDLNKKVGRDESRSKTLRIVRAALAEYRKREEGQDGPTEGNEYPPRPSDIDTERRAMKDAGRKTA